MTLECDRFGLHGASYVHTEDAAIGASDPRRLAGVAGRNLLDAAALHGYLCFSYVPSPLTMTRGVRSLNAGECARWSPAAIERREAPPWREQAPFTGSQDEALIELERLLEAAVRKRIGNATEAAVFLSGGLDSSLIADLLARAGVRLHLFTLDFGAPHNAELPLAQLVARHLGRPLHVVPAGPREIRGALDVTAAALHQPFGDAVTVPLYLLGKAAAGHASMVFNGEGGDQLFGGWTNKPMIASELYGNPDYSRVEAYLATFHRFHGITEGLYSDRARARTAELDAADWLRPAVDAAGFSSLIHRLRAANLRLKGAQNIAPRSVQLAAACGLSARSPFFDHELADWTFSLPPEWFLQGSCEKLLLKRMAEKHVPGEVVWQEKRGMGVPVTEWLLGPLRKEAARRLSPARLRRNGWFAPEAVAALRRGDDRPAEFRRRRLGEKLWALLMLHCWCDAQDPPVIWPTE